MKSLKVLSDPEETYVRTVWYYHAEIDGKRIIVQGDETWDGADYCIYHYDENCRDGIGEELDGEEYEGLYEELLEAGLFSRSVEKGWGIPLTYSEDE